MNPRTSSLGIWTPFVYQRLPCSIRSQRAKEFSQNSQIGLFLSLNVESRCGAVV
jgi:hypothetical protein